MEWAIAYQARPALLQRDILPYHLIDAGLFHYPCYGKLGDHDFSDCEIKENNEVKVRKSEKSERPEDGSLKSLSHSLFSIL